MKSDYTVHIVTYEWGRLNRQKVTIERQKARFPGQ